MSIHVAAKKVARLRLFENGWMRLSHDTWGDWEHMGLTVEEAVNNTLKKLGYVK